MHDLRAGRVEIAQAEEIDDAGELADCIGEHVFVTNEKDGHTGVVEPTEDVFAPGAERLCELAVFAEDAAGDDAGGIAEDRPDIIGNGELQADVFWESIFDDAFDVL